jgi:hypothetical protein
LPKPNRNGRAVNVPATRRDDDDDDDDDDDGCDDLYARVGLNAHRICLAIEVVPMRCESYTTALNVGFSASYHFAIPLQQFLGFQLFLGFQPKSVE